MEGKIKFEFSAEMWQHGSPGGWFFVSLPKDMSREIREHLGWQEEGWGRMKVTAQIGEQIWDTAIWFDSKAGTYLLPVKAEIRKRSNLRAGEPIGIMLWI